MLPAMHLAGPDRVDPESGASLVSVLLVLVILGGLAGVAVLALRADPSVTAGGLDALAPGGDVAGGVAATGAPRSPAAAAGGVACTSDVQAIMTSVAAKHAADGAFPATVEELVAAGLLSAGPSSRGYELTLEAVGGRPTGRVLVNGLPAEQGCAAPPRAGP